MKKKIISLKVFFHFDRLFTKLKIINVNEADSLRLSRNYRAIDYAPDIVILAGIVKIMPALLTYQMTGIFRRGIKISICLTNHFVTIQSYNL